MVGIDVAGGHQRDALEVAYPQGQVAVFSIVDQQHRSTGGHVGEGMHGVLGLMIRQVELMDNLQFAIPNLGGKRRPHGALGHLARQLIAVIARHGPEDRPTVAPQRRPHRTDARPACAFLLPQLLTRTGNFTPGLSLVGARTQTRLILADRFVKQRFVDFGPEHFVGEVERAHFLVVQIQNIDCRHGSYLFALRTTTYPPLGPGTAPFTTSTLSSVSTSTISRLRTVTLALPM